MEDPYWQSFMEQAVRLIYFLAESPDQLCSRLLQRSARLLLDQTAEAATDINKDNGQSQDGSQESGEQGERGESSPRRPHLHGRGVKLGLTCLCFLSRSELRVSGPAVGSVWLCGVLAGVSP